jgi:two-component system OmpR family sensor kinase
MVPSRTPADQARPALSIRARVIVAVMLLTAVALLLSGATIYSRGHAITEQRVAADLDRAVAEFDLLATQGLDPDTGGPFTSPDRLLRVAVQRAVLAESEGVLAFRPGGGRWTAHAGVPMRPEDDAELIGHLLPLTRAAVVSAGRLDSAAHDYRYVVVPVRLGGEGEGGAFVRVTDLRAEGDLLNAVYTTYALVALGSLLLVGLLIWILVGRLLQPIRWMRDTAARITDTDVAQRIPVRGRDDLSALAGTVNRMLDRLEAALDGQRALLDDVGHELRTPLTIVRGHLELMDPGDPGDVTATRALVLDELDRMHRLVDDLLTLAKAERQDFLAPRPTDVARLTDETLAKATGLGERHWVLDELADVEALIDPQRVAQAWLQLAANAVQYSGPGTSVGMGSRVADGTLILWVRDQGVGIPEEERARVLERLQRGGRAALHSGGTGLGLAIVASIAAAHGGRVSISSEPGGGSRISMELPVQAASQLEPEEES